MAFMQTELKRGIGMFALKTVFALSNTDNLCFDAAYKSMIQFPNDFDILPVTTSTYVLKITKTFFFFIKNSFYLVYNDILRI